MIISVCAFMPLTVSAAEIRNVTINGYCYNTLGQNVASTAFLYSTQDEYLGSVYSGYNQSFFTLECNIDNYVIPEYIVFTADVGNHRAEGVYYITEQDIQHFINGKSISIKCPVYTDWKFDVNKKTPNDLSKYIGEEKRKNEYYNNIDKVLNGDFSEYAGTYSLPDGTIMELRANGLTDNNIWNNSVGIRVEDIIKTDNGTYMWSLSAYANGEYVDGIACVLYPINVEVVSWDGHILYTDMAKPRFWCGNDVICDANYIYTKQENISATIESNDTLTLGEQKWITGYVNGIYSQIPSTDVNIVCSDENVLSIGSQDTMCISPENDGEQYLVCANAFVKGVSPGNATLTFYYKGEKLGSTDVTVEAVIADTISDEMILKANVLHKNDRYHYYKDTASSPAILLNNQFKDGYTENLASTYLFVNDLLSALTLHLENGEELDATTYYEILLADILENDSDGIWDTAYSTWKTMYGGYNNKIVQKVAGVVTDLDKVKTLDFIKNNTEKKVLETIIDYSNGQGVLKDVSVEVDVLDKLSLSADLVNDFFNAVDEVYAYSAVQQEKIDVLKNIQIHTANDNLKIACNNLIEDIKFAQENAVMYYATNFGKTAMSDLFDFSHGMVTGLVLQYITTDTAGVTPYVPGLKEAMAIIKTGRFISNSVINADDIAKNVLTVSAYADIEEEIKTYTTWIENSFATNKTVDNARNLMAHADFLKATLIQSHEVYINYVEDVKKADRNLTITGNILALLRGDLRGFIDSTKDSNASYDDVIKTAERMKTGLANEDFYSTNYMDIAAFISNIQTTTPSEWAKEYIDKAINEYYIVPDYLQGNYQNNITRAEFCTLLVGVLENYTGKDINTLVAEAPYNAKLFEDSYYEYVHYMACLGIVNGVSESEFNPLGEITREEAAVMLYRAAQFLNHDLWPIKQPTLEGISFWASDGVRFVMENGIMTGTDNGFEPQGKYTKEQAITTFVRFIENLK